MITEAQRKERLLGIGGSDIPIILGLSTYKTPYQLYLEKKALITPSDEVTEQQYWGNRLEEIIRQEFSIRNNVTIETPETLIHPFYPFLRANIDGFIPKWNSVLEVKCSSSFMSNLWGEQNTDIIPMAYLVQVAHYCSVTNADSAYIAVLIGGNEYRQYKYKRDLELEHTIINAASHFWNQVESNKPPAPVNEIDLKIMFPKSKNNQETLINNQIKEELMQLSTVKSKIKDLESIEQDKKFQIMKFMGDSEALIQESGETLVTWKSNKKGGRTFIIK